MLTAGTACTGAIETPAIETGLPAVTVAIDTGTVATLAVTVLIT